MNESQSARRFRNLKGFGVLSAIALIVTSVIVVGNRLSQEALAVLAGAVCGVGAAIPTSLLIVAISRRRDTEQQPTQPNHRYPPTALQIPFLYPYPQQPTLPPQTPTVLQHQTQSRTFTVIGLEGEEEA